jgi:Tfp pilus assembly protein PilF
MNILAFPYVEWAPGGDRSGPLPDDLSAAVAGNIRARNKRALRYLETGEPAKAIPLYKRTLGDCQRHLGPDDPSTLASRINLALSYRAAGQPAKAVPLLEQAVADCERVQGAGHPATKAAREYLAALTSKP